MSKTIKSKLGFAGDWKETSIQLPEGEPAPWSPDHAFQVVNKAVPRVDGFAKVTGRAVYATDVRKAGLLYARVLHSPHPSARILSVDTKKAAALEGVKAIEVLPIKEVRFVGQEIAAVAAVSSQIAEDAIRLIEVEYATRPFVVDTDAARHVKAPLVFAGRAGDAPKGMSGNVKPSGRSGLKIGDPEKAFREADVVVEETFRTQVQTHSCLEPHAFTAMWEGDQLTVWASTQSTFSVRDELAHTFELSPNKVRVLTEFMGGGFGSKFGARTEGILAAKLAKKAGRPVMLAFTRKAEHLVGGNRPDSVQRLKLAGKKDGTLTAMSLSSYGTGGIAGGASVSRPFTALYRCEHRSLEEYDVFTHAGPARAFRAPGHPQGVFGLESMIDILAEKSGVDPLAFRLKNDDHPVRLAQIKLGAERFGWSRRNATPAADKGIRKRGLGMAASLWYNTGSPGTQILIKIHKDAKVEVFSGGQDIGTGIRTLIAQVTAEELGLPIQQIHVAIGDTQLPYAPGSGGSKTTPCVAPTARKAAYQAKEKLFEIARKMLQLPADAPLHAHQGKISLVSDATKSIEFAKVCRHIQGGVLSLQAARSPNYASYNNIIAGVQFAEVEVDTETGKVRVLKVTAVHDCGLILNKLTARSQVNGGVIQGVSYALLEDRILDKRYGRMVNPNLEQYKIVGSLDTPEIETILFDVYAGSNNTHALGLGEPTTVPTAAAIANAIYNATGARLTQLPMTPARVLEALAKRSHRSKP